MGHIEKRLKELEDSLEENTEEIQDIKNLLAQGQGAVKVLIFLGGIVGFLVGIIELVKSGLFSS